MLTKLRPRSKLTRMRNRPLFGWGLWGFLVFLESGVMFGFTLVGFAVSSVVKSLRAFFCSMGETS